MSTTPASRPLLGGVQARLWAVLVALGVLVAVVGLGAPAASALPAAGVQNGVAAINPGPGLAVEPEAAVSPAGVGVPGLVFDDQALVSCVAPQTGGGCDHEVLVDTSAVYKYPVLVPLLESRGERGVISTQVQHELLNNKLAYPAHPFPQVPDVANSVAMARMRQQYAGRSGQGDDGDVVIGTTAISSGRKLYTSDLFLEAAVIKAGGRAEYVP